jgi:hypothetical protein
MANVLRNLALSREAELVQCLIRPPVSLKGARLCTDWNQINKNQP